MFDCRNYTNTLREAKNIIITTHLIPDADGIGSQIALCMALKSIGKNAYCVNDLPLLDRYSYLDPENVVLGHDDFISAHPQFDADLFIVVDTNAATRIGANMQKFLEKSKKLLFIDHHPCPPALMALHAIDTSAAATGQIVGDLIEALGIEYTKEIALPLYTAILIDTSSFRYPTVTGNTHRLLAKLVDTGIHPPNAYNKIYGTKGISHMHMLGDILKKTCATPCGRVGWISLRDEDIEKYNGHSEDTHAFINHLLILNNIEVACMFRDLGDGKVKVSFRSAGDVDVGDIAVAMGGGGHNHSSATIIDGLFEDVIEQTTKKITLILDQIKN
ncbi:MAG: bifunctional oligoribonuclease/PAP phosphatase NrnA [Bacteriovoracaceae bacterium]|jgi:bifunctional oligoribonuclease and PAP phosphatase NrnA|nr:bifunctional oligoribonuclease/PAP phosphatase NrnA [Bacteriovoracaceae bacterium]